MSQDVLQALLLGFRETLSRVVDYRLSSSSSPDSQVPPLGMVGDLGGPGDSLALRVGLMADAGQVRGEILPTGCTLLAWEEPGLAGLLVSLLTECGTQQCACSVSAGP